MLRELHIKHFAIIDALSIDFDTGLNVLTGETGTGKSIIIDALGLVLGERSSGDDIQHEKEQAIVEAVFDISQKTDVSAYITSLDIEEEHSEIIIKRVLSRSGKNRCSINGSIVTLSVLKEIGRKLVDIHGQHEHQSLMDKKNHVDLLDACAGLLDERKAVSDNYRLLQAKKRTLTDLLKKDAEKKEHQDFLRLAIQDIEQLQPEEAEEDKLEKEKKILANAEKLFQATRKGYDEIYSSDEAVLTTLNYIIADLKPLSHADTTIQTYIDRIQSSLYDLESISLELRDYNDAIPFTPQRLTEIENRLSEIKAIKRKYGKQTIAELLHYKDEIEKSLADFSLNQKKTDNLKSEIDTITEKVTSQAVALAQKREAKAKHIESLIEKELQDLNMSCITFDVHFSYDTPDNGIHILYNRKPVSLYPYGIGTIEFLFSPNKGEPPKPLSKIASGGEISRVMLVLKKILAHHDKISTMVFDEIDSGTGGKTSEMIGDKLKKVSQSHQILCITHLPHIASKATAHFRIEKEYSQHSTQTTVKKLTPNERVKELARMSGGKKITKTTLKHAEEMMRL